MRTLILLLFLTVTSLDAQQARRRAVATTVAASILIDENFEGTGTPAGWNVVGTPDFDNTSSPIAGSQDLKMDGIADDQAYPIFSAKSEIWMQFEFTMSALPETRTTFAYIGSSSPNKFMYLLIEADGTLRVGQTGFVNIGSPTVDAMAGSTHYWIFMHIAKGTGANAVYDVEFSTTSTRTGSGNKFTSYSSGTVDVDCDYVLFVRAISEWVTPTFQVDNVKVSYTGWP